MQEQPLAQSKKGWGTAEGNWWSMVTARLQVEAHGSYRLLAPVLEYIVIFTEIIFLQKVSVKSLSVFP